MFPTNIHNSAAASDVSVTGSCSLRPVKELTLQGWTAHSEQTLRAQENPVDALP